MDDAFKAKLESFISDIVIKYKKLTGVKLYVKGSGDTYFLNEGSRIPFFGKTLAVVKIDGKNGVYVYCTDDKTEGAARKAKKYGFKVKITRTD